MGGGTPSSSNPNFWDGDIPWVSSSDLVEDNIHSIRVSRYITEEAINKSSTKFCKGPVILIVSRVGVGKVAYRNDGLCTSQDFTNIVNFTCDGLFLSYLLSLEMKNSVSSIQGTSIKGISSSEIKLKKLFIPNDYEQEKIATFLSLIDERLVTQSKIIEELNALLKSSSQDLFSQKVRFIDIDGHPFPDWDVKILERVFYSEKGKGISKDKIVQNGVYECILYGELYTKYNEVINEVVSRTNILDGVKSKIGDLLIPSSTTTSGIDLANVTALNKNDVLLGGDITILRSDLKVNNVFYAYYLSNYKKEEIASYAQGSTIVHLYYSHIKNMHVDVPSFEEQTRIADYLLSINNKILTENKILLNYQNQKKYLLKNLFI